MIISADSAWSYGGSILTFAFPMILFIAVGAALWVLYTMPHMVPGHRYQSVASPVTATPPAASTPAGPGESAGEGSQAEGGQGSSAEGGPGAQTGGHEG
ncbi:MAG: hypothetical protein J2P35_04440 [Actinobacteria bacterium]|nr:hypothetical protein [Actinomycetota bacterium]MBO0784858.1 hypothetical protein [Actinomycetota bacterium]